MAGGASNLLQRHGDRGRLDERGLVHLDGRHCGCWATRAGLYHGLDRRLRAAGAAGATCRKFGQYTVPDFVAARYDGNRARVVAAIIGVIISFTYVAQSDRDRHHHEPLPGRELPGWRADRAERGAVLHLPGRHARDHLDAGGAVYHSADRLPGAGDDPVAAINRRALPQIMYGEALQQITQLEAAQGITKSYVTPFNDWTLWNFLALVTCLMLGTAGLPHILVRFYTCRM